MPRLIIDCKSDITVKFVLNLISSLEEMAKDDINLSIIQDQLKGRVLAPTVRYFARNTDPALLPAALLKLGEHTIIGTIYKDVREATIEAEASNTRSLLQTTRSLAAKRNFNQKSLERSLVQLRQAGLVDSERIA